MRSRFRPLRMETWIGPTTPSQDQRSRWTFKAGWHDTVNLLDREIDMLGAEEFVIEADFTEADIRLDGMPRANARQPQFSGVRIYFDSEHGPLAYQTDNCAYWQHNVRSIALGLEALRAVDRYGITHRAEQYTGFRAIGSSSSPASVFENADAAIRWLRDQASLVVAGNPSPPHVEGWPMKALTRLVARRVHPDAGGARVEWDKYEQAVALLKAGGLL